MQINARLPNRGVFVRCPPPLTHEIGLRCGTTPSLGHATNEPSEAHFTATAECCAVGRCANAAVISVLHLNARVEASR
jgi:hypothetical protein